MTGPTPRRTPDRLLARLQPGRTIDAASAVLLPYDADRRIDWDGFTRHLARTADAGITPAVNMDTGFGPQLTPAERTEVLRRSARIMGTRRFIAGAGIFGVAADHADAYRAAIDEIINFGGVPIIFQSPWLTAKRDGDLADAYRAMTAAVPEAIAFELGPAFAPFGRIYTLDEYRRLLDIEPLVGAKHSSLDRIEELERLDLRDAHRPAFKVYTGNDLAIDMVCYGSDYLLGLSTFDPEAFALRDKWWAQSDPRFHQLNDALQALGAVAFRDPVPAYKHSAAVYLKLTGQLAGAVEVHPACPRRPDWEEDILRPLAAVVEHAKSR